MLTYICQGLEQEKDPAWFTAGTEMQAQECFSGLEHGEDPACFCAGILMWVQDYV